MTSLNNVTLNYDKEFDILNIMAEKEPSYGDEYLDGITYFKSIKDGSLTAIEILDFGERLQEGSLDFKKMPFKIDFSSNTIRQLLSGEIYTAKLPVVN